MTEENETQMDANDPFVAMTAMMEEINKEVENLETLSREELIEQINSFDWNALPDDGLRGIVWTLNLMKSQEAMSDLFGTEDESSTEET